MDKIPKYQWALTLILLVACVAIARQYEVDFKTVYAVATVQNVQESYVQQPTYNAGRFFYGPFSLLLIRPFGLFSYTVAKWLWITLQTFCFFVFFNFLYKFYPELKTSFSFWLLAFIFLINPVHGNFQSNNIQLMLMAAFMYSQYLSNGEKKSQFFSGFIISLIASIKIFPAFIALFYILTKKKPVLLGLIAGALFAFVTPIVFYGWNTNVLFFHDFVANVSTYEADNELTRPDILSLASLIATYTEGKVFLGRQYLASALFIGISSLFFLAVIVSRKIREVQFPLWTLAMLLMGLLTPSARVHFWVFAVPAFCEVIKKIEGESRYWKLRGILLTLSLLMIAFTTETIVGKPWNDYFEYLRIPIWGLFIVAILLFIQVKDIFSANRASLAESQVLD